MLENLNVTPAKRRCKIRTIYFELSEADREIYMKNLSDFNIGAKTLERAFKEVGLDIGDTAINAHRKGHCSCSKI